MFKIVSSRLFCLFWNMMRHGGKLISTHIWRYGAAEMQTPFRKGLYDALWHGCCKPCILTCGFHWGHALKTLLQGSKAPNTKVDRKDGGRLWTCRVRRWGFKLRWPGWPCLLRNIGRNHQWRSLHKWPKHRLLMPTVANCCQLLMRLCGESCPT